jgi:hypothetical protein
MIDGISSAPIPQHLKYAVPIQQACESADTPFPPCLAYAVAFRETISGELNGSWNACTIIAPDFGYGLFQLTYPFEQPWPPQNWEDAGVNTKLALEHYLVPALSYFRGRGLSGDGLVLCVAAGFNEGDQTAWDDHLRGNVDLGTTNDYASAVLANYHRLIAGRDPE